MAITSVLSGGSSLQDSLGTGHLVSGSVTASAGTDAVLTCNDQSAVLTRTAAGDYTVTFGEPFIATPYSVATPVRATFATTAGISAEVYSLATNAVKFNIISKGTATVCALSDTDFQFLVIGKRYN